MSLAKSSLLFAIGTILSRVSGLLRVIAMASVFGASSLFDAFIVAYRIPNLFRDMLAEGALGSSFTKVFSSVYEQEQTRARRLLIDALKLAIYAAVLISILGVLLAPGFVDLMTLMVKDQDYGMEFTKNATGLTRLLFPYLGLMIVAAITMGALHQQGKFFLSSISSVGLNVGYIIGALVFARLFMIYVPDWWGESIAEKSISGLAIGVLLGGFIQLLLQALGIYRKLLKNADWQIYKWSWSADLKKVFILLGPAAIAASAGPINVFVNTNFATSLGEGAVSWLNYAFFLIQLPVGIFGVAIASVSLPELARSIAKAQQKVDQIASQHLQNAIELVLWLMVPCVLVLYFLDLEITQLLYQHGKFGFEDSLATAQAIQAYSFGILGYGLIKVLTSFYFAVDRTNYAMKVSLASIFVNFGANWVLVQVFGHVGLALTSSVTLSLNALMLIMGLRQHQIVWNHSKLLKSFASLAVSWVAFSILWQFIEPFIQSFHWLSAFGIKFAALFKIVFYSVMIVSIFIVAAAKYLGLRPQQVWLLIKSKGRNSGTR